MYKVFILLFIIFIINFFLLGFKEHYIDNIVLCDSDLKNFKNNKVLKEIQKGCPTTECPHKYDKTIGLDKLLNNNGNNTYTFTFTYINPESDSNSVQLTMNGKWGYTSTVVINEYTYTWDENVVKHIYADEKDYPTFIDKTELNGYSFVTDTDRVVIFKSCDTLLALIKHTEKNKSTILKLRFTKIEDYIPTTPAGNTK